MNKEDIIEKKERNQSKNYQELEALNNIII